MSKLYFLKIQRNMVEHVSEDYYYLHDGDRFLRKTVDIKKVQEGWKVHLIEVSYDFSEIEEKFKEAWSSIRRGLSKLSLMNIETEIEEPSFATLTVSKPGSVEIKSSNPVIITEHTEDFEEEEVWIFIRKGLKKRIQVSSDNAAYLRAPLKSNNKEGLTVRGYACSLVQDEKADYSEFYDSILQECLNLTEVQ